LGALHLSRCFTQTPRPNEENPRPLTLALASQIPADHRPSLRSTCFDLKPASKEIPRNPADLKPENKSLIHALHNLLTDLELTVTHGSSEEAFTELKRIVHQRIGSLEMDGPIAPATPPEESTGTG